MLKGILISTDALIAITIGILIVTIPMINSSQQNLQSYKLLAWDYLMINHSYFYNITEDQYRTMTLVNVSESNYTYSRLSPIFLAHHPLCGCATLPCNLTISATDACFIITEVNTSRLSIWNRTAYIVLNDR